MLRDERVDVECVWADDGGAAKTGTSTSTSTSTSTDTSTSTSYCEIDCQLRRIAKRRAALDSEEARWLREAEAQRIWRKLGFSTALEYLEDVFGYAPRTALERLRVAKELGQLTQLDASLEAGDVSYAAARELSRVMTPQTEQAWLARARGRNLRDIEQLVAGHKKGDNPDDPTDANTEPRLVSLRLTPAVEALLRQTRADLSDEHGHHVEDDELVEILCRRARDGGERRDGAPAPAYQLSIRRCDECGRGAQLAGGRWVPLDTAAVERAACDAIVIGDESALDARASRTIPKKVRDHVWLRDGGRCRVPGCRATRHCDLHHIIPWADGGTHDSANLVVACSGHHKVLHEGLLSIRGRAPDELAFTRDGTPLVDARSGAETTVDDELRASAQCATAGTKSGARATAGTKGGARATAGTKSCARATAGTKGAARATSKYADVTRRVEAKAALRQLGYKARAAQDALERASAHVDADADVAMLVRTVLSLDRTTAETPIADGSRDELARLALEALVQSGFDRPSARRAVDTALQRIDANVDLPALIAEALRCTRTG